MTEAPIQYVFEGNQLTRLQVLEELLDPGTQRVLSGLELPDGARCLEIGAGAGSIARWLCDLVGPTGHVVGTDLDTQFLAAQPRPNLEVRRHDVLQDPLEEGAFDLVHARLVLEHLSQREAALAKLAAALRPGGWLVIEDVDYVSGVPVSSLGAAQHERTQSVRLRMFAESGVNHYYGRELPARLRGLGLTDVGNDGRVWIMEGGSPAALWFQYSYAHLRQRLVSTGELTLAEVDEMLGLFGNPDWAAFTPIFVAAWGRRPA